MAPRVRCRCPDGRNIVGDGHDPDVCKAEPQGKPTPPPKPLTWDDVKLVDLVAFCRPGIVTTVSLHLPPDLRTEERERPWLRFGVPVIQRRGTGGGMPPFVHLGARLGRGATDEEEDSAWALGLDLIGFEFEFWDGYGHASGWIRPDDADSFNVPPPGWDPFAGAVTCDGKACHSKPHPIVGYIPKAERARPLYRLVRGLRVSIRWHHVDPEDAE